MASILLLALSGVSDGWSTGSPSPADPPAGRVVAGTASGARTAEEWGWPVAPPHPIVRAFEAPATRYTAGHRGVDIAAASGTPVLAPADGIVHFAGVVVDRPLVSIRVDGDLIGSIEPVEPAVREGDAVQRGDVIGTVGAGGHCSGGCVHLGVRLRGDYVSPLLYLGGIPIPVLLPTRTIG
ncbi:MAG: hypothetical protein RI885_2540 [Actinomycetota bacterium]